MKRRTLYALTSVNVLVLALVIAASGLGTAVAQTVQSVLVTNSTSTTIPVQQVDRAFQFDGQINIPANNPSGVLSFTVPTSHCLVMETMSFVNGVPSPASLANIAIQASVGGSYGTYYVAPGTGNQGIYGMQQFRIHADQGSIVHLSALVYPNSSSNSSVNVAISGTLVPCATATGPTVRGVSAFTAHRQGHWVHFRWHMGIASGIVGFQLYAGPQRLNQRTIPAHPGRTYGKTIRYSGSGPYMLHVLLRGGQEIAVAASGG